MIDESRSTEIFFVFLGVYPIILIVYFIFYSIGMWKMFKKCGRSGWEGIIPYYNKWALIEISGLQSYWFIICIAPILTRLISNNSVFFLIAIIVGMVGNAAVNYNISKKFNKGTAWFILSIFFGGILLPILGYSSVDKYDANVEVSENSFF